MRPIQIRDLVTGEVLTRSGATAEEILRHVDPETGERRFVRLKREPEGWVNPQAAAEAAAVEQEEQEHDEKAQGKKGRQKRSQR